MGHRHTREEVVEAAVSVVVISGFAGLTFRAVAEELGISDRMVVYYLPSKSELVYAVSGELSSRMQVLLDRAFGDLRCSGDELIAKSWPVMKSQEGDRIFALFLEVIGLSVAHVEPFNVLAPMLLEAWVTWLTDRAVGKSAKERRSVALGVVARIDGLLLIRHVLGHSAANDAARSLGI